MIEFSCDVFCEQNCESLISYSDIFFLLDGNIYGVPFDYNMKVNKSEYWHNLILNIIKANATSVESYQRLTKAWNTVYIVNKIINFHMAGIFA